MISPFAASGEEDIIRAMFYKPFNDSANDKSIKNITNKYNNYEYFSSSDICKKIKVIFKRKKVTPNDIISELKLPKKLHLNNYFGKNQSNTGHYNITFISCQ